MLVRNVEHLTMDQSAPYGHILYIIILCHLFHFRLRFVRRPIMDVLMFQTFKATLHVSRLSKRDKMSKYSSVFWSHLFIGG